MVHLALGEGQDRRFGLVHIYAVHEGERIQFRAALFENRYLGLDRIPARTVQLQPPKHGLIGVRYAGLVAAARPGITLQKPIRQRSGHAVHIPGIGERAIDAIGLAGVDGVAADQFGDHTGDVDVGMFEQLHHHRARTRAAIDPDQIQNIDTGSGDVDRVTEDRIRTGHPIDLIPRLYWVCPKDLGITGGKDQRVLGGYE